jgi:hypothetical protein
VGGSTVYRTKRRFVEGNLALALSEEARPGAARKPSGKETRCWWRRPAPARRQAASAGHWICWPARWSN